MKSNFKITIPNPCNENWDEMTPDEIGRFCRVCNKSVIDFTNKLPEEIQQFFLKNQGQKICGRFKNSQLDAVSIQIPREILFSQTKYHKIFLLALFITMGTSLFSCSSLHGDKQKIEKVEVVESPKTHKKSIDSSLEVKNYIIESTMGIPYTDIELIYDPTDNDFVSKVEIGNTSMPKHLYPLESSVLSRLNPYLKSEAMYLTQNQNNLKEDSITKDTQSNSVKTGDKTVTMKPMPIDVNFDLEKESLKSEDSIIKKVESGDINLTSPKNQICIPGSKPQLKIEKQ